MNRTASLALASAINSQGAFNVTGSPFALGAETPLAPEDTGANRPSGRIICRLHTFMVHKGQKGIEDLQELFAGSLRFFVFTDDALLKKHLHIVLQKSHLSLKCFSAHRSITDLMPIGEKFRFLFKKSFADPSGFTTPFADRRKVAFQMSPAGLPKIIMNTVGIPAVDNQNTGEVPKQGLCSFPTSLRVNHKEGSSRSDEGPKPPFDIVAPSPTGLIRMRNFLFPDVVANLFSRCFQRLGDTFFAAREASETDWNVKELLHRHLRPSFTEVEDAGQHANCSNDPRPKWTARCIVRQSCDRLAAAFATDNTVKAVLNDMRMNRRKVTGLMNARCSTAALNIDGMTVSTLIRVIIEIVVHFFRRKDCPQMGLVPFLSALLTFFSARLLRALRNVRPIGRWRSGGIEGVLFIPVQFAFKLLNTLVLRGTELFQLGNPLFKFIKTLKKSIHVNRLLRMLHIRISNSYGLQL